MLLNRIRHFLLGEKPAWQITTRAAILMRRYRSVSNWATAKEDRFGIVARKPHISQ